MGSELLQGKNYQECGPTFIVSYTSNLSQHDIVNHSGPYDTGRFRVLVACSRTNHWSMEFGGFLR